MAGIPIPSPEMMKQLMNSYGENEAACAELLKDEDDETWESEALEM
jgi:hypothetical protein